MWHMIEGRTDNDLDDLDEISEEMFLKDCNERFVPIIQRRHPLLHIDALKKNTSSRPQRKVKGLS